MQRRQILKKKLQDVFEIQGSAAEQKEFEHLWSLLDIRAEGLSKEDKEDGDLSIRLKRMQETSEASAKYAQNADNKALFQQVSKLYLLALRADLASVEEENEAFASALQTAQSTLDKSATSMQALSEHNSARLLDQPLIQLALAKLAKIKTTLLQQAAPVSAQEMEARLKLALKLPVFADAKKPIIRAIHKAQLHSQQSNDPAWKALDEETRSLLNAAKSSSFAEMYLSERVKAASKISDDLQASCVKLMSAIDKQTKQLAAVAAQIPQPAERASQSSRVASAYKPQSTWPMFFAGALITTGGLFAGAVAAASLLTGSSMFGLLGWVAPAVALVTNPVGWAILAGIAAVGVIGLAVAGVGALLLRNSIRRMERNAALDLYQDNPELQQALHEQNERNKKAHPEMSRDARMFMMAHAIQPVGESVALRQEAKRNAPQPELKAVTWKECRVAGQTLVEDDKRAKLFCNERNGHLMWRKGYETYPVNQKKFEVELIQRAGVKLR